MYIYTVNSELFHVCTHGSNGGKAKPAQTKVFYPSFCGIQCDYCLDLMLVHHKVNSQQNNFAMTNALI